MTKKTTQFSQSVHQLRSMILAGDFRPGARLLEEELMESLQMGRTPLREALLLLQGEGLIERRHGWYVAETAPDDLPKIYEARGMAEGALAALAARNATPALVQHLEELCAGMERWPEIGRAELNRLNGGFHAAVAEAADNPYILEFWQKAQFYHWQLRMPVMFSEDQIRTANAEHRAIFEAVRDGDAGRAGFAARAHVETTRGIVLDALGLL
ncbi:GntR family transcriptional regulator [Salipiger sp. H15]|uniref:GntR family transcriptional regulator n=1 Tax=Alloyangia sp. H15 TaxID=3029062 RepID=A0AAU8AP86_9RHOB